MDPNVEIVRRMYEHFNARDIEGVLAVLSDDVVWANGMEGGHVFGRDAVREYWTYQWSLVSPNVEPVEFQVGADNAIVAQVRQSVFDLNGEPIQGQTHGLTSKTVGHIFHFRDGKVTRFDIQSPS